MPAGAWQEYAVRILDKDAALEKLVQNPRHVKLAQACQWLERNAANVSKIRKKLRLEAPAQEIAAAGVAIKDAKQVVALALILRLVLGCANSSPPRHGRRPWPGRRPAEGPDHAAARRRCQHCDDGEVHCRAHGRLRVRPALGLGGSYRGSMCSGGTHMCPKSKSLD